MIKMSFVPDKTAIGVYAYCPFCRRQFLFDSPEDAIANLQSYECEHVEVVDSDGIGFKR